MPARKKAVSTQKAHLTKQEIEERTQAEASVQTDVEEIMKPPAWLNSTIAKNEWKRVIPQLLKINIAGNLDLEALAGYCNAFANYRRRFDSCIICLCARSYDSCNDGECSLRIQMGR